LVEPFKIRLPDLVRLAHASGRSNVYVVISEGLTEVEVSRQDLQSVLSSKEVAVGKSAVFPRF
jgi:hypothetical protein